jgi:hypothetical protein
LAQLDESSRIAFAHATLHVRRVKKGKPASHPLQGDVMRALRPLATRLRFLQR